MAPPVLPAGIQSVAYLRHLTRGQVERQGTHTQREIERDREEEEEEEDSGATLARADTAEWEYKEQ